MPHNRFAVIAAHASPLLAAFIMQSAAAETPPAEDKQALEQIVVTGTRVANRSALEAVAPVDVVAGEAFRDRGVNEVSQALSIALPAYNFPRNVPGRTVSEPSLSPGRRFG